MASTQRELEEQLTKAGERLLEPLSSDDELLSLLDQIEGNLSTVEQSPSKSMQTALKPCLNGLVENKLLKHPNVDVKVSVATCISEITRITAPDAPYDDEKMKEIFELIVLSFEDLADKSSRSYSKRTLILDTVAKVRSCVVMLDLECDGLIVKMFQHFLKSIRDYHPEGVFTSMETIMTLVLEESEDISIELITPILSALKKDNKDVSSVAQKLGERVFGNCAKKLKSCLIDAKKSLGISLDEYSDIVASISDDAVRENNGETCEEHEVEEIKLPKSSSELVVQAEKLSEASLEDANKEHIAQESAREASPGREGPVVDGSGTSVLSNGISESKIELKLDNDIEASQKLDGEEQGDKSSDGKGKSNEADDLESGKIVSSENKTDQTSKKRGRKAKSSTKSAEPSDSSRVDGDKEAERLAESTTATEETHNSPKDLSHEATLSSENEKVVKLSPPEVLENEPVNAAPSSPSGSVPDEGRPKRANAGRSKKKEKLLQEASLSTDVSEKPSEGANDSEAKPPKRSAKKVPTGKASQEKTSALVDTSKGKGVPSGDSEAKLPEQSDKKKIDSKDNDGSEPSSKKVDKRKRGRGKSTSEKPIESSAKDDDKEALSSPTPDLMDEDVAEETPKVTSKRKRGPGKDDAKETPKSLLKSSKVEDHSEETPKTSSKSNSSQGKGKASDNIEYGKNLVGSNIQVWWPDDEMFYKGVITAYHQKKKQHTVLYTDDEVETLNLKDERWEFIEADSLTEKEQATGDQSPKSGDPSLEKPKKKKAKTDSQTPKQGKGAEEVAPSRSKKASGREAKDEKKVDEKSKDKSSKSVSKSEDGNSVKAKDKSKKSGGKSGESSKSAGKSKDVDSSSTPKMSSTKPSTTEGSAKSATKDTPEASAATKSKGKSPKTQGLNKTDTVGGSDKEKSVSGKTKEVEGSKKTLSEKVKTPVSGTKKKSSPEETPKSQPSETKSGKKRGRGSRH